MKIPGSDWVHPWARPSRASQVVRLSAPVQPAAPKPEWERLAGEITGEPAASPRRDVYPGILDALPSPRGFDAIVFGDWTPDPDGDAPLGWRKQVCPACDVTWYGPGPCWCCARPGEPP